MSAPHYSDYIRDYVQKPSEMDSSVSLTMAEAPLICVPPKANCRQKEN